MMSREETAAYKKFCEMAITERLSPAQVTQLATRGIILADTLSAAEEERVAELEDERDRLREATTRLCGAAARVMLASPSHGPLWHGSQEMKELQEALLSDELKKLMGALQEAGNE